MPLITVAGIAMPAAAKILAENCGKTVEQIMKDFDRDYWMDANEAVAYGIVDKVIDSL